VGHGAAAPEAALVWVLFVWNAIVFFQQPFGYLLAGVSEVRRVTYYSVFSAVSSLALMWLLARPLGAPGVALGLILGYAPFSFLGTMIESFRYLHAHRPEPATPRVCRAWGRGMHAKMWL
jgi:O-antigen/teichoic acid export membrane protein